uniref:EF-hand domain-containing protein n=1 Tax=Chromera velia CCMP2878 TaxID=1169474 RepID=A0A0G4HC28_9ALVE|eukprot:Cvel_6270.t1-p1 / transcript=Cvel_6270.t1 / gene=Cvel_6270 / organism=Chromera_velia_CCMP2878 / gene_product=hypothetical protein / transcript_product=hypothetical protein / location=Cvel_scaffold304:20715-50688(-) / protein_length=5611 / sequence_SO=supercontig / SO=protein_coding / is_pseudo=false
MAQLRRRSSLMFESPQGDPLKRRNPPPTYNRFPDPHTNLFDPPRLRKLKEGQKEKGDQRGKEWNQRFVRSSIKPDSGGGNPTAFEEYNALYDPACAFVARKFLRSRAPPPSFFLELDAMADEDPGLGILDDEDSPAAFRRLEEDLMMEAQLASTRKLPPRRTLDSLVEPLMGPWKDHLAHKADVARRRLHLHQTFQSTFNPLASLAEENWRGGKKSGSTDVIASKTAELRRYQQKLSARLEAYSGTHGISALMEAERLQHAQEQMGTWKVSAVVDSSAGPGFRKREDAESSTTNKKSGGGEGGKSGEEKEGGGGAERERVTERTWSDSTVLIDALEDCILRYDLSDDVWKGLLRVGTGAGWTPHPPPTGSEGWARGPAADPLSIRKPPGGASSVAEEVVQKELAGGTQFPGLQVLDSHFRLACDEASSAFEECQAKLLAARSDQGSETVGATETEGEIGDDEDRTPAVVAGGEDGVFNFFEEEVSPAAGGRGDGDGDNNKEKEETEELGGFFGALGPEGGDEAEGEKGAEGETQKEAAEVVADVFFGMGEEKEKENAEEKDENAGFANLFGDSPEEAEKEKEEADNAKEEGGNFFDAFGGGEAEPKEAKDDEEKKEEGGGFLSAFGGEEETPKEEEEKEKTVEAEDTGGGFLDAFGGGAEPEKDESPDADTALEVPAESKEEKVNEQEASPAVDGEEGGGFLDAFGGGGQDKDKENEEEREGEEEEKEAPEKQAQAAPEEEEEDSSPAVVAAELTPGGNGGGFLEAFGGGLGEENKEEETDQGQEQEQGGNGEGEIQADDVEGASPAARPTSAKGSRSSRAKAGRSISFFLSGEGEGQEEQPTFEEPPTAAAGTAVEGDRRPSLAIPIEPGSRRTSLTAPVKQPSAASDAQLDARLASFLGFCEEELRQPGAEDTELQGAGTPSDRVQRELEQQYLSLLSEPPQAPWQKNCPFCEQEGQAQKQQADAVDSRDKNKSTSARGKGNMKTDRWREVWVVRENQSVSVGSAGGEELERLWMRQKRPAADVRSGSSVQRRSSKAFPPTAPPSPPQPVATTGTDSPEGETPKSGRTYERNPKIPASRRRYILNLMRQKVMNGELYSILYTSSATEGDSVRPLASLNKLFPTSDGCMAFNPPVVNNLSTKAIQLARQFKVGLRDLLLVIAAEFQRIRGSEGLNGLAEDPEESDEDMPGPSDRPGSSSAASSRRNRRKKTVEGGKKMSLLVDLSEGDKPMAEKTKKSHLDRAMERKDPICDALGVSSVFTTIPQEEPSLLCSWDWKKGTWADWAPPAPVEAVTVEALDSWFSKGGVSTPKTNENEPESGGHQKEKERLNDLRSIVHRRMMLSEAYWSGSTGLLPLELLEDENSSAAKQESGESAESPGGGTGFFDAEKTPGEGPFTINAAGPAATQQSQGPLNAFGPMGISNRASMNSVTGGNTVGGNPSAQLVSNYMSTLQVGRQNADGIHRLEGVFFDDSMLAALGAVVGAIADMNVLLALLHMPLDQLFTHIAAEECTQKKSFAEIVAPWQRSFRNDRKSLMKPPSGPPPSVRSQNSIQTADGGKATSARGSAPRGTRMPMPNAAVIDAEILFNQWLPRMRRKGRSRSRWLAVSEKALAGFLFPDAARDLSVRRLRTAFHLWQAQVIGPIAYTVSKYAPLIWTDLQSWERTHIKEVVPGIERVNLFLDLLRHRQGKVVPDAHSYSHARSPLHKQRGPRGVGGGRSASGPFFQHAPEAEDSDTEEQAEERASWDHALLSGVFGVSLPGRDEEGGEAANLEKCLGPLTAGPDEKGTTVEEALGTEMGPLLTCDLFRSEYYVPQDAVLHELSKRDVPGTSQVFLLGCCRRETEEAIVERTRDGRRVLLAKQKQRQKEADLLNEQQMEAEASKKGGKEKIKILDNAGPKGKTTLSRTASRCFGVGDDVLKTPGTQTASAVTQTPQMQFAQRSFRSKSSLHLSASAASQAAVQSSQPSVLVNFFDLAVRMLAAEDLLLLSLTVEMCGRGLDVEAACRLFDEGGIGSSKLFRAVVLAPSEQSALFDSLALSPACRFMPISLVNRLEAWTHVTFDPMACRFLNTFAEGQSLPSFHAAAARRDNAQKSPLIAMQASAANFDYTSGAYLQPRQAVYQPQGLTRRSVSYKVSQSEFGATGGGRTLGGFGALSRLRKASNGGPGSPSRRQAGRQQEGQQLSLWQVLSAFDTAKNGLLTWQHTAAAFRLLGLPLPTDLLVSLILSRLHAPADVGGSVSGQEERERASGRMSAPSPARSPHRFAFREGGAARTLGPIREDSGLFVQYGLLLGLVREAEGALIGRFVGLLKHLADTEGGVHYPRIGGRRGKMAKGEVCSLKTLLSRASVPFRYRRLLWESGTVNNFAASELLHTGVASRGALLRCLGRGGTQLVGEDRWLRRLLRLAACVMPADPVAEVLGLSPPPSRRSPTRSSSRVEGGAGAGVGLSSPEGLLDGGVVNVLSLFEIAFGWENEQAAFFSRLFAQADIYEEMLAIHKRKKVEEPPAPPGRPQTAPNPSRRMVPPLPDESEAESGDEKGEGAGGERKTAADKESGSGAAAKSGEGGGGLDESSAAIAKTLTPKTMPVALFRQALVNIFEKASLEIYQQTLAANGAAGSGGKTAGDSTTPGRQVKEGGQGKEDSAERAERPPVNRAALRAMEGWLGPSNGVGGVWNLSPSQVALCVAFCRKGSSIPPRFASEETGRKDSKPTLMEDLFLKGRVSSDSGSGDGERESTKKESKRMQNPTAGDNLVAFEDFCFLVSGWRDVFFGRLGDAIREKQLPLQGLLLVHETHRVNPLRLFELLLSYDLPLPRKLVKRAVKSLRTDAAGNLDVRGLLEEIQLWNEEYAGGIADLCKTRGIDIGTCLREILPGSSLWMGRQTVYKALHTAGVEVPPNHFKSIPVFPLSVSYHRVWRAATAGERGWCHVEDFTLFVDRAIYDTYERLGDTLAEKGLKMSAAFALFDSDGSGKVDFGEFFHALDALKVGLSPRDIRRLYNFVAMQPASTGSSPSAQAEGEDAGARIAAEVSYAEFEDKVSMWQDTLFGALGDAVRKGEPLGAKDLEEYTTLFAKAQATHAERSDNQHTGEFGGFGGGRGPGGGAGAAGAKPVEMVDSEVFQMMLVPLLPRSKQHLVGFLLKRLKRSAAAVAGAMAGSSSGGGSASASGLKNGEEGVVLSSFLSLVQRWEDEHYGAFLVALVTRRYEGPSFEEMLRQYDAEGKGFVSRRSLKQVLSIHLGLSQRQILALLRVVPQDSSEGGLFYVDLLKALFNDPFPVESRGRLEDLLGSQLDEFGYAHFSEILPIVMRLGVSEAHFARMRRVLALVPNPPAVPPVTALIRGGLPGTAAHTLFPPAPLLAGPLQVRNRVLNICSNISWAKGSSEEEGRSLVSQWEDLLFGSLSEAVNNVAPSPDSAMRSLFPDVFRSVDLAEAMKDPAGPPETVPEGVKASPGSSQPLILSPPQREKENATASPGQVSEDGLRRASIDTNCLSPKGQGLSPPSARNSRANTKVTAAGGAGTVVGASSIPVGLMHVQNFRKAIEVFEDCVDSQHLDWVAKLLRRASKHTRGSLVNPVHLFHKLMAWEEYTFRFLLLRAPAPWGLDFAHCCFPLDAGTLLSEDLVAFGHDRARAGSVGSLASPRPPPLSHRTSGEGGGTQRSFASTKGDSGPVLTGWMRQKDLFAFLNAPPFSLGPFRAEAISCSVPHRLDLYRGMRGGKSGGPSAPLDMVGGGAEAAAEEGAKPAGGPAGGAVDKRVSVKQRRTLLASRSSQDASVDLPGGADIDAENPEIAQEGPRRRGLKSREGSRHVSVNIAASAAEVVSPMGGSSTAPSPQGGAVSFPGEEKPPGTASSPYESPSPFGTATGDPFGGDGGKDGQGQSTHHPHKITASSMSDHAPFASYLHLAHRLHIWAQMTLVPLCVPLLESGGDTKMRAHFAHFDPDGRGSLPPLQMCLAIIALFGDVFVPQQKNVMASSLYLGGMMKEEKKQTFKSIGQVMKMRAEAEKRTGTGMERDREKEAMAASLSVPDWILGRLMRMTEVVPGVMHKYEPLIEIVSSFLAGVAGTLARALCSGTPNKKLKGGFGWAEFLAGRARGKQRVPALQVYRLGTGEAVVDEEEIDRTIGALFFLDLDEERRQELASHQAWKKRHATLQLWSRGVAKALVLEAPKHRAARTALKDAEAKWWQYASARLANMSKGSLSAVLAEEAVPSSPVPPSFFARGTGHQRVSASTKLPTGNTAKQFFPSLGSPKANQSVRVSPAETTGAEEQLQQEGDSNQLNDTSMFQTDDDEEGFEGVYPPDLDPRDTYIPFDQLRRRLQANCLNPQTLRPQSFQAIFNGTDYQLMKLYLRLPEGPGSTSPRKQGTDENELISFDLLRRLLLVWEALSLPRLGVLLHFKAMHLVLQLAEEARETAVTQLQSIFSPPENNNPHLSTFRGANFVAPVSISALANLAASTGGPSGAGATEALAYRRGGLSSVAHSLLERVCAVSSYSQLRRKLGVEHFGTNDRQIAVLLASVRKLIDPSSEDDLGGDASAFSQQFLPGGGQQEGGSDGESFSSLSQSEGNEETGESGSDSDEGEDGSDGGGSDNASLPTSRGLKRKKSRLKDQQRLRPPTSHSDHASSSMMQSTDLSLNSMTVGGFFGNVEDEERRSSAPLLELDLEPEEEALIASRLPFARGSISGAPGGRGVGYVIFPHPAEPPQAEQAPETEGTAQTGPTGLSFAFSEAASQSGIIGRSGVFGDPSLALRFKRLFGYVDGRTELLLHSKAGQSLSRSGHHTSHGSLRHWVSTVLSNTSDAFHALLDISGGGGGVGVGKAGRSVDGLRGVRGAGEGKSKRWILKVLREEATNKRRSTSSRLADGGGEEFVKAAISASGDILVPAFRGIPGGAVTRSASPVNEVIVCSRAHECLRPLEAEPLHQIALVFHALFRRVRAVARRLIAVWQPPHLTLQLPSQRPQGQSSNRQSPAPTGIRRNSRRMSCNPAMALPAPVVDPYSPENLFTSNLLGGPPPVSHGGGGRPVPQPPPVPCHGQGMHRSDGWASSSSQGAEGYVAVRSEWKPLSHTTISVSGLPAVPWAVKECVDSACTYFRETGLCPYCSLLAHESGDKAEGKRRVLHRTKHFVALVPPSGAVGSSMDDSPDSLWNVGRVGMASGKAKGGADRAERENFLCGDRGERSTLEIWIVPVAHRPFIVPPSEGGQGPPPARAVATPEGGTRGEGDKEKARRQGAAGGERDRERDGEDRHVAGGGATGRGGNSRGERDRLFRGNDKEQRGSAAGGDGGSAAAAAALAAPGSLPQEAHVTPRELNDLASMWQHVFGAVCRASPVLKSLQDAAYRWVLLSAPVPLSPGSEGGQGGGLPCSWSDSAGGGGKRRGGGDNDPFGGGGLGCAFSPVENFESAASVGRGGQAFASSGAGTHSGGGGAEGHSGSSHSNAQSRARVAPPLVVGAAFHWHIRLQFTSLRGLHCNTDPRPAPSLLRIAIPPPPSAAQSISRKPTLKRDSSPEGPRSDLPDAIAIALRKRERAVRKLESRWREWNAARGTDAVTLHAVPHIGSGKPGSREKDGKRPRGDASNGEKESQRVAGFACTYGPSEFSSMVPSIAFISPVSPLTV